MKKNCTEKGTLALVSLGCAKNAVDFQNRIGAYLKKGWKISEDPDHADVCLVNTCSFIAPAREEAEAEIRRALELKRCGNYGKVIVSGCYPERYPERRDAFPGVDDWLGVPKGWQEPPLPAFRLSGFAHAYLKIAEGCNHRCTYCAIPLIRGRYTSRPMASILREARALVETGCRELNVIAQDPMRWKDGKHNLVSLLREIDRIKGDFWVRVLYSYPNELTEDFIVWMMTSPHAVKYVDIPIQHTVPAVLEKMNRARAVEASRSAAEVLREIVPDITVRTTIMTGFPGETEARFKEMLADLKRMQFDHLGAFAYSPEEGTKAASFRGKVKREVAEARERLVMKQQEEIWKLKSARMLGKAFRALVVARGVARMESQAPDVDGVVFLTGRNGSFAQVGDFVKVQLMEVEGFDFIGKVVR